MDPIKAILFATRIESLHTSLAYVLLFALFISPYFHRIAPFVLVGLVLAPLCSLLMKRIQLYQRHQIQPPTAAAKPSHKTLALECLQRRVLSSASCQWHYNKLNVLLL